MYVRFGKGAAETELLCGVLLPAAVLICGLFFAVRLDFFRRFGVRKIASEVFARGDGTQRVPPLRAAMLALAGTLGVGNIVGVATALGAGGPGALLWMTLAAVLAAPLKYAEVSLGVLYRRKTAQGFVGGAPYYMRDALGAPRLAVVFSAILIVNTLSTGCVVQSAAAAGSVYTAVESLTGGAPQYVPAIVCAAMAAALIPVMAGGAKRMLSLAGALIPVLALGCTAASVILLAINAQRLPDVIADIARSAVGLRSAASGVSGYALAAAVRYGVTRGALSNEAGCGTAPAAHAAADARSPSAQGCLGVFEVAVDAALCLLTGLVLLVAGVPLSESDGIGPALDAYGAFGGGALLCALAFAVVCFAYATLVAQCFYGAGALAYLTRSKPAKAAYFAAFAVCTAASPFFPPAIVWIAADASIAALTLLNLAAITAITAKRRLFLRE